MNERQFANTLVTLRNNKNYTQSELAKIIGCSDRTISRAEHGANISSIILIRMLIELDVLPDDETKHENENADANEEEKTE